MPPGAMMAADVAYLRPRRERAFSPDRLRRGIKRGVAKLAENLYRVEGRHEDFYNVDLSAEYPCDCLDAQYHGRGCLHELVARLHAGDAALIQSLGDMLLAQEKHSAK